MRGLGEHDRELNIRAYADADALFKAGRIREALRQFRVASDADPDDSDCWFALGSCFDALKQPKRAEAAYLKALAKAPESDHPALNFNIGNALFDQQRFEQAIARYVQVPRGHAVYVPAQRNRCLAESKLKSSK
jgi:tetratricopeptide (TPR) repeat protein